MKIENADYTVLRDLFVKLHKSLLHLIIQDTFCMIWFLKTNIMSTLAHLVHQNYKNNPEKISIVLQHAGQEDISISYHDLVAGSARYARTYARTGIQPGEVVVLILQHGADLIYSFWGAILHGAIPAIMPFLTEKLSPERYRTDLSALISVTQPAAIVTYPNLNPTFDQP